MTPTLRPYQDMLVSDIEMSYVLGCRRPLAVLPTGGGKTVVFSKITENEVVDGKRVWILAHRQELLAQASRTLKSFGIRHSVQPDFSAQVLVASTQTIVRRLAKLPEPDLIILDEGHHGTSPTVRKIFDYYPDARKLGVTATPCRLNGAGLGSVYDDLILGPTNTFLTDNGFLSPAKYYAPPIKADTSKLKIQAGDYSTKQSEEVMDEPQITGDAITHYRQICDGAPMLVFCVSVAHAHHVAEQYRTAGYRAAAVDGNLSDDDRDDRITGLGTGKYQVITSCDLIGEGLDVPSVTAVQLLRPTASLALHLQQIGRGLRMSSGKDHTYVLDHVGNVGSVVNGRWMVKHGFASTDHHWTLDAGKKVMQGKAPPTRTCEECFSVHLSKPVCPYCGYEYPKKEKTFKSLKHVDGKLVEIEQTKEQQRIEVKKAKTYPELYAIAKARKYKRPHFWAIKVLRGRPIDISELPG